MFQPSSNPTTPTPTTPRQCGRRAVVVVVPFLRCPCDDDDDDDDEELELLLG